MEFAGDLMKKIYAVMDNLPSIVDMRREALKEIRDNPSFKSGLDSIKNYDQRQYIPSIQKDNTREEPKIWDPNAPQTWDDSAPIRDRIDTIRKPRDPSRDSVKYWDI